MSGGRLSNDSDECNIHDSDIVQYPLAALQGPYVANTQETTTTYTTPTLQSQHSSSSSSGTILDIIKSYDPSPSPKVLTMAVTLTAKFELGPSPRHRKNTSTTVAICKTCEKAITPTMGICEQCKKTIVMPSAQGEMTSALSPAVRNFASIDLPQLEKDLSGITTPTFTSPKRRAQRHSPQTNLADPPIRLSSLDDPPPPPPSTPRTSEEGLRPRELSLNDLHESFLRLQISRYAVSSAPRTPTTPPSTSHSHSQHSSNGGPGLRTRPSSLANITTPQLSTRHNSATLSEFNPLYPYFSSSTTAASPPSVGRASYQLQNTMSAWDDWDSEGEGEKVGLIGYWKEKKWMGSKGSSTGASSGAGMGRRESAGKEGVDGKGERKGREMRAFVKVISCGCLGQ
ncbi:hypothetical protein K458DRAFT_425822 [Lentithecium fluviatile CBS 122367]|uniref:Uncharacterized protein n=1 Tax=Lentithecium fluviatile CBS 122367 TaxID=1168545 RepID=A0A6G1JNB1_9PLEO|nr:hypothetical protein K458DRAFT_425822 [Lentithecium fluviatile CBS 122367]